MRVLWTILLALWASGVLAQKADHHEALLQAEEGRALPSCEVLPTQARLCGLIRHARERVQKVPISIFQHVEEKKRGKKVTTEKTILREFVLTAYDPTKSEWHDIVLAMPLVGNSVFQPLVRTEHDPPYKVVRVKGQTFNKMTFDVRAGERKLFVYAGKHLSIPSEARGKDIGKMRAESQVVTYLSTPPYLANEEFAKVGKAYVMAALEEVLTDLRKKGIASKAFRGKLVGEQITAEMLMNLLVTEQTDPCLLKERDKGCIHLVPAMFYQNDEDVMEGVLSEFVLNGFAAYRHVCSVAPACGAFQFTNIQKTVKVKDKEGKPVLDKKGRPVTELRPGTYDRVRAAYPGADLDPDFRRGTKSFFNSAKAAALLVDHDLSLQKTPAWVREAFMTDHRVGLLFPAAAYNGGAVQLQRLAELLLEFAKLKGIGAVIFETFPWNEFLAWVKAQATTLHPETFGYIKKSLSYWTHPRMHKSLLPAAAKKT